MGVLEGEGPPRKESMSMGFSICDGLSNLVCVD
jgi:hypothetical protein